MRKRRRSALHRARAGLNYKPPPPPDEAERRKTLFSHVFRLGRMVLLHKIFGGGK